MLTKTKILIFTIVIILISQKNIFSQNKENIKDKYKKFYFENGKISSEGYLIDGKPNAYWKTYYKNGNIKSEGNRKNFMLDSLWNFYFENGKKKLEVNYKNNSKNGIRKIYRENEIIEEYFVDDVKEGISRIFYKNGNIKKIILFKKGLEQGFAKVYSKNGKIIELIKYKNGFVVERQNINRLDKKGNRQGKWINFYKEGEIKDECIFRNNKKNGFFKSFDKNGELKTIKKFKNNIEEKNVSEIVRLETRKEYFEDGKIKAVATYKNNIPEGIRREYNRSGSIERAYIYKKGIIIAEGIIDEDGIKNSLWKEFYINGNIKSEGEYLKDKRIGEWKFFYENGKIEQKGKYNNNGNFLGNWFWYYESGNLLREENYINGKLNGFLTEYCENGDTIINGEYLENLKEGFWTYKIGDYIKKGEYLSGMRNGSWKYYYKNSGVLYFQGKFIDDNPNGKHIYYWENGNKKDEYTYIMGIKQNKSYKFDIDGIPILVISYKNGIEKKYDGIPIKPEL